jgi:hypothetical protein
MTVDKLIQTAIADARIPIVRRELIRRYDADPEAFRKHVASVALLNRDDEFAAMVEANQEIDPEKFSKWNEILMKLLPLILLLM